MTEVRDLAFRTSRDGDVLELAERIYVRLATRSGNALNPHHALDDAASALSAADTFYRAADEWFTTRRAVAAGRLRWSLRSTAMTAADARRWIFTELAFGGTPVRRGGSLFELKPVTEVLKCAEQAHKVRRKHGVTLRDLVLVETLPSGEQRQHWQHIWRPDAKEEQVPA